MPNISYPSETSQYIAPVLRANGAVMAWPSGTQFAFYDAYDRPQSDPQVNTTFAVAGVDALGNPAALKPAGMSLGTWFLWARFHNGSEYIYVKSAELEII